MRYGLLFCGLKNSRFTHFGNNKLRDLITDHIDTTSGIFSTTLLTRKLTNTTHLNIGNISFYSASNLNAKLLFFYRCPLARIDNQYTRIGSRVPNLATRLTCIGKTHFADRLISIVFNAIYGQYHYLMMMLLYRTQASLYSLANIRLEYVCPINKRGISGTGKKLIIVSNRMPRQSERSCEKC